MTDISEARPTKSTRRGKAQMMEFRQRIYDIVEKARPCSVRQVYYLGVGILWEKDTRGSRASYKRVDRELCVMRESNMIPFKWISDGTRFRRIPTMFARRRWPDELTSVVLRSASSILAETYRRDLWADQPRHVEVWAESDSISGVIDRICRELGVGLFSCRGQASKTFAYNAAQEHLRIDKPVTILYVGDWDPTGLAIPRSLEQRLRDYSGDQVELEFTRCALTAEDIRTLPLTTHEVNDSDPNYRSYAESCELVGLAPWISVEVEALPPDALRERLRSQLYRLVEDPDRWNAAIEAQDIERERLELLAGDY